MTIAELKEAIKDLPDYMPVILEKDAEGNGYSPLASVNIGMYEPLCSYAGEVHWFDNYDDDYTQYDKAAILGPVN